MVYGKRLAHYDRTNVETAGKAELIVLCYEKTIQFLLQAKSHYEAKEFEKKARKFQKALDIINELRGCLNFKEGGQIAKNLDAIYAYLIKRLLIGDIKMDLDVIDESVQILSELKEAWELISSGNEKKTNGETFSNTLTIGSARLAA